jgi:hypothetical protein
MTIISYVPSSSELLTGHMMRISAKAYLDVALFTSAPPQTSPHQAETTHSLRSLESVRIILQSLFCRIQNTCSHSPVCLYVLGGAHSLTVHDHCLARHGPSTRGMESKKNLVL